VIENNQKESNIIAPPQSNSRFRSGPVDLPPKPAAARRSAYSAVERPDGPLSQHCKGECHFGRAGGNQPNDAALIAPWCASADGDEPQEPIPGYAVRGFLIPRSIKSPLSGQLTQIEKD
jgi:hypothetical protein